MWVWFTIGCFVVVVIGLLILTSGGNAREVRDLRVPLIKQHINFMEEEIDAAHEYFDWLQVPRQYGNARPLTLVERIGLVHESMPPTGIYGAVLGSWPMKSDSSESDDKE